LAAAQLQNPRIRYSLFVVWLLLVGGALYLYFFERSLAVAELRGTLSTSTVIASIAYLLLGSLRAFTMVPATFLLFVAIPFFEPALLLALTLVGIASSSSICYFFAEALHMDAAFERKYPVQIQKLKTGLRRYQLPIIIGWSFFLLLPTDLICYVCGSLRINFKKFFFGVVVGEGLVYAIYIYLGDWILRP